MNRKIKEIKRLFFMFLKIGAFTFGGGYAMIPLIKREAVEKQGWISNDDILEIVAIAESTPGPIAINAATFVGYRVGGFFGALFATLGVVIPSFTVIALISCLLEQFQSIKIVSYAFFGVRAGTMALIVNALYAMYRQCPKNPIAYFIIAVAFAAVVFLQVNIVFVIVLSGVIGLGSYLITERRKGR